MNQASSSGLSFLSRFDPSEFYEIAKDLPNSLELQPEIETTTSGNDNIQIITTHLLLPQDSISKLFQGQSSYSSTESNAAQYTITNIDDLSNMLTQVDQSLPATSKLPSADPFLGLFNFQLSLASNEGPVKKTASWTYSKILNKVYCLPGVSVPVELATNDIPPLGTVIRAMAIYGKAEHGQQAITRCENHKKNREFDKDVTDESVVPHFVRLRDVHATYMTDPVTQRQSVCVPFEKPQPGLNKTTVLIQFMCYSSCVGGTQKPVKTVLTIEYNGEILGRASFEVKICACPGRDRMNEEKKAMPPRAKSINAKPTPPPIVETTRVEESKKTAGVVKKTPQEQPPAISTSSTSVVDKFDLAKKSSITVSSSSSSPGEEETFILKVKGRKNYEMLKQLNEALELKSTLASLKRSSFLLKPAATTVVAAGEPVVVKSTTEAIKQPVPDLDKTVMEENGIKETDKTSGGVVVESPIHRRTISSNVCQPPVKRKEAVVEKKRLPTTLESFLESIDMSAYYNLIASKGINNLSDLLGSNKRTLNSFRISKNDTNKLWEAIQSLNQKMTSSNFDEDDDEEFSSSSMINVKKKPKLSSAPTILNESLRLFSFNDSMMMSNNNLNDLSSLGGLLDSSNYVKLSKCQIRYSFNMNQPQ